MTYNVFGGTLNLAQFKLLQAARMKPSRCIARLFTKFLRLVPCMSAWNNEPINQSTESKLRYHK